MPTLRDNDFEFTMSGLTDVRFQETNHSITDNQPYDGVSRSAPNQLRVRAGRKGSEGVAGWFNRETRGCAVAKTYSDHNPGKLNFAVRGKLVLTVGATTYQSEPDVFLAQGHTGSSNNWWLGSSGMTGINWTGGALLAKRGPDLHAQQRGRGHPSVPRSRRHLPVRVRDGQQRHLGRVPN